MPSLAVSLPTSPLLPIPHRCCQCSRVTPKSARCRRRPPSRQYTPLHQSHCCKSLLTSWLLSNLAKILPSSHTNSPLLLPPTYKLLLHFPIHPISASLNAKPTPKRHPVAELHAVNQLSGNSTSPPFAGFSPGKLPQDFE
jgi:hypothetical protein